MTRDVEMELSIWEMLLSVKRHWALVLVAVILCSLMGGAFGYLRLRGGGADASDGAVVDTAAEDATVGPADGSTAESAAESAAEKAKAHQDYVLESFDENQKIAEESEQLNRELAPVLREVWYGLKALQETHPLMTVDPTNCVTERMTVLFDPAGGNHDSMVSDWLRNADGTKLFGSAADQLLPYREDLILVGTAPAGSMDGAGGSSVVGGAGSESGGESNSPETTLTLIGVDGFDVAKAVSYLKTYLPAQAKMVGLTVQGITTSELTGFSPEVVNFRRNITDRMSDIRSRLGGMYEDATAEKPERPTFEAEASDSAVAGSEGGISLRSLLKYILIGFALGLILGMVVAIFLTLHQGALISRRQVEETFNLELLSDCSKENPAALEILNANLDVMVGEDCRVMLLGSASCEAIAEAVSDWNKAGGREFVAGRNIFDDSETIDALSEVDGILLGIRIGKSKLADIQRVMLRAHKLDKRILGYVLM